jgi:hypothetical protein
VADFWLIGSPTDEATIAEGSGIRELARLVRVYGQAHWRKRKGRGVIELGTGEIRG